MVTHGNSAKGQGKACLWVFFSQALDVGGLESRLIGRLGVEQEVRDCAFLPADGRCLWVGGGGHPLFDTLRICRTPR